jgi:hypothetical protein
LALASPANCCFQASNPPGPLPHCAALALLAIHANAIRVMEVAAASRLHLIIEKLLFIWSTPARARQSGMYAPRFQGIRKLHLLYRGEPLYPGEPAHEPV